MKTYVFSLILFVASALYAYTPDTQKGLDEMQELISTTQHLREESIRVHFDDSIATDSDLKRTYRKQQRLLRSLEHDPVIGKEIKPLHHYTQVLYDIQDELDEHTIFNAESTLISKMIELRIEMIKHSADPKKADKIAKKARNDMQLHEDFSKLQALSMQNDHLNYERTEYDALLQQTTAHMQDLLIEASKMKAHDKETMTLSTVAHH